MSSSGVIWKSLHDVVCNKRAESAELVLEFTVKAKFSKHELINSTQPEIIVRRKFNDLREDLRCQLNDAEDLVFRAE